MFPATIKQLVITSCKKINDLTMQTILSYFLVVSSWNEPREYFHTFHIVAQKLFFINFLYIIFLFHIFFSTIFGKHLLLIIKVRMWLSIFKRILGCIFQYNKFIFCKSSCNLYFNIITIFPVCLLYTSPSPRDNTTSRMPSSA